MKGRCHNGNWTAREKIAELATIVIALQQVPDRAILFRVFAE